MTRSLIHFAACLVIGTVLFSPAVSRAESDEGIVCAAVLPCDESGNVLEGFSDPESPCAAIYKTQCAHYANAKVGNELLACNDDNDSLGRENASLRKLNAKLQRKLRAARRARR